MRISISAKKPNISAKIGAKIPTCATGDGVNFIGSLTDRMSRHVTTGGSEFETGSLMANQEPNYYSPFLVLFFGSFLGKSGWSGTEFVELKEE